MYLFWTLNHKKDYPGPEKFFPYSKLMTIPRTNGRPVCSRSRSKR